MVPIRQNLLPSSKYFLKVPSESIGRKEWDFIVVHETDNYAPAINEVSFMIGNDSATAYHYAVDDIEIVQGVLDTMGAFSTSNRFYDARGLAIEICYNMPWGEKYDKARKNAVAFIAHKLYTTGKYPNSNTLKTHHDATGKNCPRNILASGWAKFCDEVRAEWQKLKNLEDDDMTEADVRAIIAKVKSEEAAKPGQSWSKEARDWAISVGLVQGDGNGYRWRDNVSREEVIQILRNAKHKGIDL